MPALLSRPPMPTSSSFPMLALFHSLMSALFSPVVPTLLSLPMPASLIPPVSALSSCSMFGPAPTHLISSVLKIFKYALSNKLLRCNSTSPSSIGPLCLILTLGPLPEKNNCKRFFDTAFINSRLLVGNYAAKEVDLTFGEGECPVPVKLNRLW